MFILTQEEPAQYTVENEEVQSIRSMLKMIQSKKHHWIVYILWQKGFFMIYGRKMMGKSTYGRERTKMWWKHNLSAVEESILDEQNLRWIDEFKASTLWSCWRQQMIRIGECVGEGGRLGLLCIIEDLDPAVT